MKVTVIVEENNGEVSKVETDLSQWMGMAPGLILLAAVMERSLARTCLHCIALGMNVLTEEYSDLMQQSQKERFCKHLETP